MKTILVEIGTSFKASEGYHFEIDKNGYVVMIADKPKRLELSDLDQKTGWYINEFSNIIKVCDISLGHNFITAPHEYLCTAYMALLQCIWLSEHETFNGQPQHEWADWNDGRIAKYAIVNFKNKMELDANYYLSKPLAFKTEKLAEKFLNDYPELLETAKPLL